MYKYLTQIIHNTKLNNNNIENAMHRNYKHKTMESPWRETINEKKFSTLSPHSTNS